MTSPQPQPLLYLPAAQVGQGVVCAKHHPRLGSVVKKPGSMMHLHSEPLLAPDLVVHGQRVPPTPSPSHAVLASCVWSHR